MSEFVQSLEQRTLFAVTGPTLTADLATVNADAKAVRAQLKLVRVTVLNDVKTIQADLKGLSSKSNAKLLATLKADDARSLAKLTVAQTSYLASSQALAVKTTLDAKMLVAHPSNSRLRDRVASDISKLNSNLDAKSSALQSAVSALDGKFNNDVLVISAANPGATTLANDVTIAETGVARVASIYLTFAGAFNTDAGVLATDAGSI
jgi:hypothetical protein